MKKTVGEWESGRVGKFVRRALVLALPLSHVPTLPLAAQETSLTIYADGRLLVRRTLNLAVPRGASTQIVDLGVRELESGSVVALDEGVNVTGSRLVAAAGQEGSLRRALGAELLFRSEFGNGVRYSTGRVLSVDPVAIRVDSGVMYGFPGVPVFPQALVQLSPLFELSLDAARPLTELRLLYQSSGLAWSASYALLVPRGGAGQAGVTGTAEIMNNAGIAMSGVQVQLLAGAVRRAGPQRFRAAAPARAMEMQAQDVSEEAVGGTHVYTLPGLQQFVPGETRTIALFPRTTAAVETELALSQSYGIMNQWPEPMRDQHPEISYRVRRPGTPAGSFGALPLPGGVVRVYEPDSAGRAQLVGEVAIDHTPAGRDLRLPTGTSFDVTATRTQTAYERRSERDVTGAFRVELRNAGPRAVTVNVRDTCPGRCEIESASIRGELLSVNMVNFPVPVPAGGTATLDYRIRARW